jgi:rRNA maturation RNase YbeY
MVKSSVRFGYADRKLPLGNKRGICHFIVELVSRETGKPCKLQYVFCSDEYLHQINVSFLQHDDYTDIITFDLSGNREKLIEGEVYISVDRVKDNRLKLKTGFETEMLRVIFHGALHLCGYKDKKKSDKAVMRGKEDEYLNLFAKLQ